jgi:hypothetical protein
MADICILFANTDIQSCQLLAELSYRCKGIGDIRLVGADGVDEINLAGLHRPKIGPGTDNETQHAAGVNESKSKPLGKTLSRHLLTPLRLLIAASSSRIEKDPTPAAFRTAIEVKHKAGQAQ